MTVGRQLQDVRSRRRRYRQDNNTERIVSLAAPARNCDPETTLQDSAP